MKGNIMNRYLKLIAAGALALGLVQTASASTQVRIGVYADAPVQYRAQPVRVQPYYVPAPVYYAAPAGYVEPAWSARHDWRARREARLRREEWLRREQWRREHWRREQWRHEHGHHERDWDRR
jgi:hypothetical protein